MPVKTAYRVLEIPENAPADDIKNAYRIMALKWHPDRHHNGHDKDAATRRFLEVTNAYRTLVREGRVNSPVAQPSRRDPSPRRPIRRPPTPMVHKNSSESSGSDDSFVHMVRSTSVDTLPTPASSKRESLRASWGKNKGSRVPAADPMPGPSRGDASARQPPTFNYQPPPARGTGKGPSIYAPPVQPYAPGPPVPPQPMPKTSGRAPPASSSRPPPPAAYPAPSVPKPNPRQPVNNPPPTNPRPLNNLHPPPIPRPAKDLNPPTSSSRPPNNTRPPNNLQPPTNPSRPPNNVQPLNNPYPSHNLRQPTNPHLPMNPYPPINPQPLMNSRPPMNPMNQMNPQPPMNSRPPVNLRPPLNTNPPTNSRPPVNPHPPMNPYAPMNLHAPINPRLPMSGPRLPMNQPPPLNSHAPMNANNRGPLGQDSYKHVHTPHIPPHNSHNPRNQKPASPYEIPLTSLGPGPSGEWAYSLPLTLEDIFRGKQLRFGITRAYLSAKTKLKHVVIEIDIPAGCRAGTPILCRNVGHERQPGVFQDIAFVIEEVPHGCFVRVQDDLVMDVRLPWVEGLRRDGGKVPFTGIDGKSLGFQIDFQRDRVMKGRNVVKGAGMPVRDRGQVVGRGNLIIQWEILPPQPKMMHFMRRLWGGK